jgi:hypothetical protein
LDLNFHSKPAIFEELLKFELLHKVVNNEYYPFNLQHGLSNEWRYRTCSIRRFSQVSIEVSSDLLTNKTILKDGKKATGDFDTYLGKSSYKTFFVAPFAEYRFSADCPLK